MTKFSQTQFFVSQISLFLAPHNYSQVYCPNLYICLIFLPVILHSLYIFFALKVLVTTVVFSPLKWSFCNAAGPAYYVFHPQKGITIGLFFLTYQAFKNREGIVYQTNLAEWFKIWHLKQTKIWMIFTPPKW